MTIDFKKLAEPFPASEVKKFKGRGGVWMSHITARTVMNRLDQVAGPENWRDEYRETERGVVCTLYLRINDEWVGKSDIGSDSDIEAEKGAYSGALKRAAVRWGIGRELYGDGTAFEDEQPQSKPAPKSKASKPAPPQQTPPANADNGEKFAHQGELLTWAHNERGYSRHEVEQAVGSKDLVGPCNNMTRAQWEELLPPKA